MNSKVARTTTPTPDEPNEDRLGSLPDSVLCNILSFLPTKYAAITSVLSTKWKYLFLCVPKIDLDESLLLKPPREKLGSSRNDHDNRDFINFVNRRLMLCETSSITEFRLKYRSFPEAAVINLWLATLLLGHVVKVLEIEVQNSDRDSPPLWMPSEIFRSETLVVLKLCGRNIVFKIPEYVYFPNLKMLHLKDLDMQFESNNCRLAEEGYPQLEDLSLDGIRFRKNEVMNTDSLEINLLTLKKLAIIGVEYELSRIDIDTPHLQHLECTFPGRETPKMQINLYKCESLASADLSISRMSFLKLLIRAGGRWLLKFLSRVNKVKELKLSGAVSQILCLPSGLLPQFPNLIHMDLHLELTATNRGSVWNLLQRTPKLTSLVCNMVLGDTSHFLPLTPGERASRVVAQNLREIRIRDFREHPDEFEVVRFFLQKGAVLERMIIERPISYKKLEWASSTSKQLLKFGRRSPKCTIALI